jgi:hypothetical protein
MKTAQKIWRTINFKITEINEDERSFMAVASDNSTDRHGERIEQEGWDLENFIKNPVVPWGHDYYNPPVATAVEVGLKDGKLMFKPKFATVEELSTDPSNPSDWAKFVDTIYNMYKGGYLRAFSVGFIPTEMDGDTFKKQELLEISAVTVPSNPNALALAYKEGVIDESERKILIKTYEAQIKGLTELGKVKNNDSQEIDMEEVKTLIEAAVKELKDAFTEEVAELKSKVEEVETKLADIAETKDADDVTDTTDDVTDPDEAEENSDNSDEDVTDEGDDSKELSDEEAEKMLKQLTEEEIDKQLGKVD